MGQRISLADEISKIEDTIAKHKKERGKEHLEDMKNRGHVVGHFAAEGQKLMTATWDRRNHRALRYKCDDQTAIKRLLDSRQPLTCDKTVPVVRPAYERPRSNLTSSKHLWGDF